MALNYAQRLIWARRKFIHDRRTMRQLPFAQNFCIFICDKYIPFIGLLNVNSESVFLRPNQLRTFVWFLVCYILMTRCESNKQTIKKTKITSWGWNNNAWLAFIFIHACGFFQDLILMKHVSKGESLRKGRRRVLEPTEKRENQTRDLLPKIMFLQLFLQFHRVKNHAVGFALMKKKNSSIQPIPLRSDL